jgi:hypothetical protein
MSFVLSRFAFSPSRMALTRAEPAPKLEYWNGGMMGVETEAAEAIFRHSTIPE